MLRRVREAGRAGTRLRTPLTRTTQTVFPCSHAPKVRPAHPSGFGVVSERSSRKLPTLPVGAMADSVYTQSLGRTSSRGGRAGAESAFSGHSRYRCGSFRSLLLERSLLIPGTGDHSSFYRNLRDDADHAVAAGVPFARPRHNVGARGSARIVIVRYKDPETGKGTGLPASGTLPSSGKWTGGRCQ
jgi:hypothetical protein